MMMWMNMKMPMKINIKMNIKMKIHQKDTDIFSHLVTTMDTETDDETDRVTKNEMASGVYISNDTYINSGVYFNVTKVEIPELLPLWCSQVHGLSGACSAPAPSRSWAHDVCG